MIRVEDVNLADVEVEGVMRAIRSDLSPANASARDLLATAGTAVDERLESVGVLPLGGAVLTPGGDLPADFLIHVVVMSDDEPQTSATVRKALRNGLRRAADFSLQSIAIPPLGLGVGLTEPEEEARALVELLVEHLGTGIPPSEITIAATSDFELDLFARLIKKYS